MSCRGRPKAGDMRADGRPSIRVTAASPAESPGGTRSAKHVAQRVQRPAERMVWRGAVTDDECGWRALAGTGTGTGTGAGARSVAGTGVAPRVVTEMAVIAEIAKSLDRQPGPRGAAQYPG